MNVALCIVLTCLPVLITGCKRQHRLALPAEERSENKVALALGKSSENINAREQFLIPLDEEPAKDFGTDEKEKEKNNAEENKKENISKKERASEKKKVNPDPNQKINTSKESRKKTRETREDDAPVTLDFSVENNTGRTIFVTCFSYIKKRVLTRCRGAATIVCAIR